MAERVKGKALNRAEMAEAATTLRRLLGAVEAGELTAPAGLTYRLQGAVIALEALATGRIPTAEDLAREPR